MTGPGPVVLFCLPSAAAAALLVLVMLEEIPIPTDRAEEDARRALAVVALAAPKDTEEYTCNEVSVIVITEVSVLSSFLRLSGGGFVCRGRACQVGTARRCLCVCVGGCFVVGVAVRGGGGSREARLFVERVKLGAPLSMCVLWRGRRSICVGGAHKRKRAGRDAHQLL